MRPGAANNGTLRRKEEEFNILGQHLPQILTDHLIFLMEKNLDMNHADFRTNVQKNH